MPTLITLRRATPTRQRVEQRVQHWGEFYAPMPSRAVEQESGRCMDCGVPFCLGDTGCPVQNMIPEWNGLVRDGRWRDAAAVLHSTNNFPELTGRLCPAPCESACVRSLADEPVSIRAIEQSIADRAFADGWIAPQPPRQETGRRVGVVGSGPAGLAAAQQLRRSGHGVVVFERDDRVGGLLRYGIPDFKLEKAVLDRRIAQLVAEGVEFRTGVTVGADISAAALRRDHDAICLAVGASQPRDIAVPGRDLRGIHWAMDFLTDQNRRLAGSVPSNARALDARGKRVVIVGGGDTGSDCAGTSIRQGALSVRQFEILSAPPEHRSTTTPWPLWPLELRTSHAHEEGCTRSWSAATTGFIGGPDGAVRWLRMAEVESSLVQGRRTARPIAGTESLVPVDLVLLAMGFAGVEESTLLRDLGVRHDRGTIAAGADHATDVDGVFVAGDARRGASLIVWAIREGRDAAAAIDRYLKCRPATSPAASPTLRSTNS